MVAPIEMMMLLPTIVRVMVMTTLKTVIDQFHYANKLMTMMMMMMVVVPWSRIHQFCKQADLFVVLSQLAGG